MTVTLPPTTAVAVRTHRHQLDDLLRRLDIKAELLLNAEQWDEQAIVLTAKLRFVFAEVIGKNEQTLANYLSNTWGYCGFTEERLADGFPFQADTWTEQTQPLGFYHDYLDHLVEEHGSYLPHGWVDTPHHEFRGTVQPATGERLLDLLNDHSSIRDVEDVVNAYFLGADRERCGEALVSTGYITNQQNLTGGDDVIRWAYQAFNPALIQALVDRSEENQ